MTQPNEGELELLKAKQKGLCIMADDELVAPLTFAELESANRTRCDASYGHLQTWSPTDWGCAMGGECGEALNLVKKLRRLDDGDQMPYNSGADRDDITRRIGDELGDLVIYADLLATRLGLSLGRCVRRKFNVVSARINSPVKLL